MTLAAMAWLGRGARAMGCALVPTTSANGAALSLGIVKDLTGQKYRCFSTCHEIICRAWPSMYSRPMISLGGLVAPGKIVVYAYYPACITILMIFYGADRFKPTFFFTLSNGGGVWDKNKDHMM